LAKKGTSPSADLKENIGGGDLTEKLQNGCNILENVRKTTRI